MGSSIESFLNARLCGILNPCRPQHLAAALHMRAPQSRLRYTSSLPPQTPLELESGFSSFFPPATRHFVLRLHAPLAQDPRRDLLMSGHSSITRPCQSWHGTEGALRRSSAGLVTNWEDGSVPCEGWSMSRTTSSFTIPGEGLIHTIRAADVIYNLGVQHCQRPPGQRTETVSSQVQ